MFEKLIEFFAGKKKSEEEHEEKQVVPGTELAYDPHLIDELKADHQNLIKLYGQIAEALEKHDEDKLKDLLEEFTFDLRSHLLKENLKLYIYLKHALVDDAENLAIMNELREEMQMIGKKVNQFLSRYAEWPWSEEQKASFPGEFERIGKILVKRIEREEHQLYTLYMPPDRY